jgi:hypothetical protein
MKQLVLALFLFVLPATVWAQPAEVRQEMNELVEAGFFDKCAVGDDRACSYFVRLLVYQLNPSGNPNSYGALAKGGGHNIDGYAEDAIAANGNSNDLRNVYDLVAGAGAPGARLVWQGPFERRASDVWEAPRALNDFELAYLVGLSTPNPNPSPTPNPNPAPTPQPQPVPVNLQPVLDKLGALEAAVLGLQGDLLDREYVIQSIDNFKLELANITAQNAMLIQILNEVNAKLAEPVELKGSLLGIPLTLRKQ